uniref:Uncharacterized protein n=1 Tax=Ananas comosus var. bracteatus TaxID=296719 RepID=A0A6V7NLR2_ANACO|nr:unnamed protein product [Ananas comosus var. bracteatus]
MDPCPSCGSWWEPGPEDPVAARPAGAGVHPSAAPCYCKIRLNKLSYQTAVAPLVPSAEPSSSAAAAAGAAPPQGQRRSRRRSTSRRRSSTASRRSRRSSPGARRG